MFHVSVFMRHMLYKCFVVPASSVSNHCFAPVMYAQQPTYPYIEMDQLWIHLLVSLSINIFPNIITT